ncbi:unnamed protein product [Lactuca saligna]|uniref:Uncharacterized protein n=1 Tax=Lactuca saligna TaxID=75948 RepID=A0AA35V7R3_LACSI|nr:unnamed protein product [Lactuca saligna]
MSVRNILCLGHLKVASLNTVSLLLPKLYAELFDGNCASNEDDCYSHHNSKSITQPPPFAASPSGNPNRRAKPSTPRPRAPNASPDPPSSASPKASIIVDDLALEMQKALRHLTQGTTIPQCLKKL